MIPSNFSQLGEGMSIPFLHNIVQEHLPSQKKHTLLQVIWFSYQLVASLSGRMIIVEFALHTHYEA